MSWSRTADAADHDARRTAILAAARQQAVNFTTLDYRHLDRDLGRVLHGSTGDFRKQFRAGTNDLTSLVTQNKATSRGRGARRRHRQPTTPTRPGSSSLPTAR